MDLINNLLESNKDIHEASLVLIQHTAKICKILKTSSRCSICNGKLDDHHHKQGELVLKEDVLEFLKISASTYHRFKRDKILIPVKIGKRDYFYKSDLIELVAERKRKGRY